MVFIVDTRNQKDGFVVKSLEKLGHTVIRSKLPFGDIAVNGDILNCIDLKSSGGGLIELAKNICSKDHSRVKREITNCLSVNGKITFLCFEPNINSVEDIAGWEVPKFKGNLYKNIEQNNGTVKRVCLHRKGQPMTRVKPETLMKAIKTMTEQDHYKQGFKVNFEFTTKEECGEKIIKILRGEQGGS